MGDYDESKKAEALRYANLTDEDIAALHSEQDRVRALLLSAFEDEDVAFEEAVEEARKVLPDHEIHSADSMKPLFWRSTREELKMALDVFQGIHASDEPVFGARLEPDVVQKYCEENSIRVPQLPPKLLNLPDFVGFMSAYFERGMTSRASPVSPVSAKT